MTGATSTGEDRRSTARGYLFLASHMRSYSSLLAHILGSHAEIDGYSELHRSYHTAGDLRAMTRAIEEATGERRRGRYALDKVLHNEFALAPSVLDRDDVRVVFMLRHPAATLPSIARIARGPDGEALPGEATVVSNYYLRRLEHLDRMSAHLGTRAVFVPAERLIDDTDAVLARLTRWLALRSPLAPTYRTFPFTGVDGHGDPSPAIRSGRVLADDRTGDAPSQPIEMSVDAMRAATEAYERLLAAFRSRHAA